MTIAACHVSPEGVVFGADSTTTIVKPDGKGGESTCQFDYAQKVFEIGPSPSTVGLVTWGLGQIGNHSHRTVCAHIGRRHQISPFATLQELAEAIGTEAWRLYETAYAAALKNAKALQKKADDGTASQSEIKDRNNLVEAHSFGYCVGGRLDGDINCAAFTIEFDPREGAASIERIPEEEPVFWGVPFIMERLVFGFDAFLIHQILQSGKWGGTEQELVDIVTANQLIQPTLLPIREAIDWIHTVIHTTIRGVKFAQWPHVCGGPVEIAIVTTDRPFRWVCHKPMNAAIITAQETAR